MPRFDGDVFLFGTAMAVLLYLEFRGSEGGL
jgi:hypothetical protein